MVNTIIAVHDRNVGTVTLSSPMGKEDMRDESICRFAPVLMCVTSRERRYLMLHVTNRAVEYNLEIGTFLPGDPNAGKFFYRCTCKGLSTLFTTVSPLECNLHFWKCPIH